MTEYDALEDWRPVVGYEGLYEVSNLGRVKSLFNYDMIMKGDVSTGYSRVRLYKNKISKTYLSHRLLGYAFLGLTGDMCINHKDGNKLNNNILNLEVCTELENRKHAWETGLNRPNFGEKNGNSKLTSKNVKEIKEMLSCGLLTQKQIADSFRIYYSTIHKIKRGYIWGWL